MAQRILGVDLGAYSVKIVELEVGFRQSKLRLVREARLLPPEDGEDPHARAVRTLHGLIVGLERPNDVIALALGEDATLRLVDMPFQDARKIDQVIGYELESQILGELEGLVVDQVLAETRGEGARVLAIGADRLRLRELLDAMATIHAEPRYVGAALLAYGALTQQALPAYVGLPAVEAVGESPRPPERDIDVVIDLGHECTRVAFVEAGRTIFARAIQRGGAALTLAIAESYRLDEEAAERAKHAQAQLLDDPSTATDPTRRKLDAVLREALRPLLRDVKQTFAAARGQGAPAPRRMVMLGGGAKLPGLQALFAAELGTPLVSLELTGVLAGPGVAECLAGPGLPGIALGMALGVGLGVGAQVNLRKGAMSYRTDYAYLRGKAGYLAAALLALLACVAINADASLRALRKESEVLELRLKRETIDLFGAAKLDGRAVSEELRRGPQSGMPPVPALTAYDVLDEISRHLPPRDQVKLDVLELDIKPKKTFIKATAGSAKEIDALVEGLKQIECFGEIQKGKVASITTPGPDGKDKIEVKQFTLTIETTCP